MRLTTIKLSGFKSFVDPTVLHLLDEFETAVYRTMKENASHG